MYRIDDPTAAATLPASEAAGTEGFFTDDTNPGTKVTDDWLNMVQEELRNVVLAGALTPSKTVNTQVRDAIIALIGSVGGGAPNSIGANGYLTLFGLLTVQWGYYAGGASEVTINYPVAFAHNTFGVFVSPLFVDPNTGGAIIANVETGVGTGSFDVRFMVEAAGVFALNTGVACFWLAFGN